MTITVSMPRAKPLAAWMQSRGRRQRRSGTGTVTVSMPRAKPLAAWVTAPANDDHERDAYREFYAERYPRPEGSVNLDERVA